MDSKITDTQYNKVSLAGMFQEDDLKGVQATLRDATGISFFIIDYKGNPVTDHDNTVLFCPNWDSQDAYYRGCQIAYAMAGATSAIQSIPYIFSCPEGMLNIAVPLIVKNQYLGALIGGPVICGEDEIKNFDFIHCDVPEMEYNKDVLPGYGIERLDGVAQLVYRMAKLLGEKQSCQLDCSRYDHNTTHYEAVRKRNKELSDRVDELTFRSLRMKMPAQLFLNYMTSLANIAVMENAEKTEGLLSDFSYLLRQYLLISNDRVSIDQELKLTEQYLNVLLGQFDHAFEYRINCQPMMESQQIPSWCLVPYVTYMVDAYLESRNTGGHFFIDVEQNGAMCRISMQMEGGSDSRKSRFGVISDRDSILDQMEDTEKRFRYEYDDNYYIAAAVDRTILEVPVGG